MTDQEKFEKWFNKKLSDFPQSIFLRGDKPIYKISWEACAEQKNAIIEQQAKEIEHLKIEVAKPRWIPVDDKCKDGRYYIYRLQDDRIYYGAYCFHQHIHITPKLNILVKDCLSELEFSEVVEYMELPE